MSVELREPEFFLLTATGYEGSYDEGTYHGKGKITFCTGQTYYGDFDHGRIHGRGRVEWPDGCSYEGDMHQDKISGKGKLTWSDGSTYEGDLKGGVRNGYGCLQLQNGMRYDGYWENGTRHGEGTLIYDSSGDVVYEGSFVNGLRHGKGKMRYKSGNVYEGEWNDGQPNGEGKMEWPAEGIQYIGEFKNGLLNGKGEQIWKTTQDGPLNRYFGDFDEGRRHGNGTFFYANGSKFIGTWESNRKNGEGTHIHSNGTVIKGELKSDKMSSNLQTTSASGLPSFVFNIDDLLSDAAALNKDLNSVVGRELSFLRSLYNYYSSLWRERKDIRKMGTLQLKEFWVFAKDADLLSFGVSLADLDRILFYVFSKCEFPRQQIEDVHGPENEIHFRDFLETLIRISVLVSSTPFGNIKRGFQSFVDNHLRESNSLMNSEKPRTFLWSDELVEQLGDLYSKLLQEYEVLMKKKEGAEIASKIKKRCEKSSPEDRTLTLRDLLLSLSKKNLFDDSLTPTKILDSLSNSHSTVDREIVFAEYVDALCHCGVIKFSDEEQNEAVRHFISMYV